MISFNEILFYRFSTQSVSVIKWFTEKLNLFYYEEVIKSRRCGCTK
ncbi:hypothetical protein SAMN04487910_4532 [Aquimarina amphilecti]|uniref:Uncharacterized protein n=1 Tax=Aquimarina amphilecti TaxID=1038014 RepID=A0A1H7WSY6_AQUAM|nr:hypothetical protein SAMN04487910_4532 [Aquimarina amphilecti]